LLTIRVLGSNAGSFSCASNAALCWWLRHNLLLSVRFRSRAIAGHLIYPGETQ